MKITFLGTGNAFTTEVYNTCFAISMDDGRHLMVDAGGGNTILRQLKYADLKWQDMTDIIVTHKHIDHIMGMVWMMRRMMQSMAEGSYDAEVRIYGHDEVIELLKLLAEQLLQKKTLKFLGDKVKLITVSDGESMEIAGKKVTFFDVGSTKDKQYGFCMEMGDGQKLTCCGDEPYNEREYEYAVGSKWLLHEAFCLHGQADIFRPYEKHHATAKNAGELAEKLGVKNLVLYHTEDKTIKTRKEAYSSEAKEGFSGNVYVPDDLDVLEL